MPIAAITLDGGYQDISYQARMLRCWNTLSLALFETAEPPVTSPLIIDRAEHAFRVWLAGDAAGRDSIYRASRAFFPSVQVLEIAALKEFSPGRPSGASGVSSHEVAKVPTLSDEFITSGAQYGDEGFFKATRMGHVI